MIYFVRSGEEERKESPTKGKGRERERKSSLPKSSRREKKKWKGKVSEVRLGELKNRRKQKMNEWRNGVLPYIGFSLLRK